MTATDAGRTYRGLSLWHDRLPGPLDPRAPLPGDTAVDVAIVGAGFTGLWTAYWLLRADPTLRVAVLEREVAGFGASGRNGGWCSALFPTSWRRLARDGGADGARAMQRALEETVAAVGSDSADEGIDCGYVRGGTVSLARGPAQLARARAHVADARTYGFGPDTLDLLDVEQAMRRVSATRVSGAVTSAHCAALDPARLVRGLAEAVERRGGTVYERTAALSVEPGRVVTEHGTVRADVVLPAVEGYLSQLPGRRRELAPVYSLMLATEPLPDEVWAQIGLADRATFTDERHLTVYGQRTPDGRLAFGGRGAPYHWGSKVSPAYDRVERVHASLRETLVEMFPVLRDVAVTHTWGGNLGVPRDWFPSVGFEPATGLAWAGGYVGDGVATAHLAGRTVADLVLRRDTARTEARTGRPSRAAAAFWRSLGD